MAFDAGARSTISRYALASGLRNTQRRAVERATGPDASAFRLIIVRVPADALPAARCGLLPAGLSLSLVSVQPKKFLNLLGLCCRIR